MTERTFTNTRYAKKRASCDVTKANSNHITSHETNLQKFIFKQQKPKSSRKDARQIAELTLTMDMLNNYHSNSKKNNLSLLAHPRTQTHRVNPGSAHQNEGNNVNMLREAGLSELREQVEQLRMENESLKEELRGYKSNEKELKYELMKMEEEKYSDRQKYETEVLGFEQRLQKYSMKIKQLYEELINEKKKKVGNEKLSDYDDFMNMQASQKFRIQALSPTPSSVCNINYFKCLEEQGEKEYYASIKQYSNIGSNQRGNWSIDHSHLSSAEASKKLGPGMY